MNDQQKEGRTVPVDENSKQQDLEGFREDPVGRRMTTDQGLPIESTDDSLKAGTRGPTLLEDFHFREKITRFDHERIPERVVHARGSAAHGYFQVYESMAELTKAGFLQDPSQRTPVFVRFSTVVGSRGSADTVRDVRGFAVKFYTSEGNFDLVGNNIPVFFIQDGIKFPDLVHAAKPDPDREIPGASTAHDTFWDFASLVPESAHMLMWILSDRALPRSYRMMEGFGVHTFRFVNAQGKARFVKFHWKPLLGVHSLVLDEALTLAGKDSEFHRSDLWRAIEQGDFPEYELGVQIVEEEDEHRFDFDLLDATKLIPEELVPVRRIGRLTLNRNPDNFFAETEQVAFHVGNVVPGIDFTNDPLLQARLFSYLDTQLTRLGGPNHTEIPINRPVCPVHNVNQDGFHRQAIHQGRVNYSPNSLAENSPMTVPEAKGGYRHYMEKVEGQKIRKRSESFQDHTSQAALFYRSLSGPEQEHLIEAAHFELGKVVSRKVRERVVELFNRIDADLARRVALGVGLEPPTPKGKSTVLETVEPGENRSAGRLERSAALSQENTVKDSIRTRRIAVLASHGYHHAELTGVKSILEKNGATVEVISKYLGTLRSAEGESIEVDHNQMTVESVMYDAVYVPGGPDHVTALMEEGDVHRFLAQAYRHCKPLGATGEGIELLGAAGIRGVGGEPGSRTGVPATGGTVSPGSSVSSASSASKASPSGPGKTGSSDGAPPPSPGSMPGVHTHKGVVTTRDVGDLNGFSTQFVQAIAQHRHWDRADKKHVAA